MLASLAKSKAAVDC